MSARRILIEEKAFCAQWSFAVCVVPGEIEYMRSTNMKNVRDFVGEVEIGKLRKRSLRNGKETSREDESGVDLVIKQRLEAVQLPPCMSKPFFAPALARISLLLIEAHA